MSRILSGLKWIAGIFAAIGTGAALLYARYTGKKDQKAKQVKENYDALKKEQAENAKPRPSSKSDRDSLRDNDF